MGNAILKHKIRVLIILMLFGGFLGRYEYKMPRRNFADFHVNYRAGQKLAQKADIYDQAAYQEEKIANFKYPPIVALVFLPLGLLPENFAAVLWYTINFIFILIIYGIMSQLFFDKSFKESDKNWIYFLTVALTARYFLYNFDEGQVNFLMMVTLTTGVYLMEKKREAAAGIAIAFSALVKYMSAIIIPYALFEKRGRFLLYFILFLFAFTLLPFLFIGWNYNLFLQKSYLPFLCRTSLDTLSLTSHQNQSLIAALMRFLTPLSIETKVNLISMDPNTVKFIFLGLVAMLYALVLIKPKRLIDYSILFLFVPIFNPNGWIHAFIFLVFPYFACLHYLFKVNHQDKAVWILVVASFVVGLWPERFFFAAPDVEATQLCSLMTFSTFILLSALLKIKFNPHESYIS